MSAAQKRPPGQGGADRYGVVRPPGGSRKQFESSLLLAIRQGRISRNAARERYGLTEEDLTAMQVSFAEKGVVVRRHAEARRPIAPARLSQKKGEGGIRNLSEIPLPAPPKSPEVGTKHGPVSPGSPRFTPWAKRDIVEAICDGVARGSFTLEEALTHCGISMGEYDMWKEDFFREGTKGLRATRIQETVRRRRIRAR